MGLPTNISTDYLSILNEYYYGSPVSQSRLWARFAALANVDPANPTEALKSEFRALIQRYTARGFAPETLTGLITIPASSDYDFYRNYLMAFYGGYENFERNDIWEAFVRSMGEDSVPPDSAGLRAAFAKFISGLRDREVLIEAETALSPAEKKARLFVNDVIGSLRAMLDATSDLVQKQAELLIFYGKYQEEYTKEMTRTPALISGDPGKISFGTGTTLPTIANLDFSQFKFGYYNITFREVIECGLQQAVALNKTWSWTPTEATADTPSAIFTFKPLAGPPRQLEVHLVYGTKNNHQEVSSSPQLVDLVKANGEALTYDEILMNTEEKFKTIFTGFSYGGKGFIDELNGKPGIPGRWLSKTDQNDIDKRAEQNAVLQQYVETVRSYRASIRSKSSQAQTTLQESREAIDKIASLWTSILETIDSIIHAIFQKK